MLRKLKYMAVSRDQNAEQKHDTKIDNNSFEREIEFKYLGTLTHQNSILEEINRLKSGNAYKTKYSRMSIIQTNWDQR